MIVGKEQPIRSVVTTIRQSLSVTDEPIDRTTAWVLQFSIWTEQLCMVEVDMFKLCVYDNM